MKVFNKAIIKVQIKIANKDLNYKQGFPGGSTGAVVEYVLDAADFFDNGYNNITDPRQSPYSQLKFTTNASSIVVTGTTNMFEWYPAGAHIGVHIDGVEQSPLVFSGNGQQDFPIDLSGGTSVVLTSSILTSPVGTPLGSYIDSVSISEGSSFVVTTPSIGDRTLLYGDSIICGAGPANPEYDGVPNVLRRDHSLDVMCEAWGQRSFHDDASTAGLIAAFAAKVYWFFPNRIWLAIGTNDFGLEKWSAADFGTAYANMLVALHTALPDITLYCQTPLIRTGADTPNTFGDVLADYATAITSACSGKSYAVLINGLDILELTDLTDGLHPTEAGHIKYAGYIAAIVSGDNDQFPYTFPFILE